jgi:hypothetical protein
MAERLNERVEVAYAESEGDFAALSQRPTIPAAAALPAAYTGRLCGFSLEGSPLVSGLRDAPREIFTARTTVPIRAADVGCSVVLVFESGDLRNPIIVGMLQEIASNSPAVAPDTNQADSDQTIITAEREIVLRCGDASITLTRAGKVLISGRYVVSRSSGYNKVKGAAVDIN